MIYAAALLVTVTAGVASRRVHSGLPLIDKSLGDVLYAAAAYFLLGLVVPRLRPAQTAGLALAWCLAVEFFQLTSIPARFAHSVVVRWLLGTQFGWHDVGCYVVGAGLALVLDQVLLFPAPKARF